MSVIFGQPKEKVLGKVIEIPISQISPNPNQPRKNFSEYELRELSLSISENGVLQPLSVRKLQEGSYELIAGERRLRAAKLSGLTHVPCIQIDTDMKTSSVLALIENLQREDLGFFEEAAGIAKLIDFYGITQEETAKKIGKSQSAIANKMRLLKLSDSERKLITENRLTERHARTLLKLSDRAMRLAAIEKISELHLNVSQTEELVESMLSKKEEEPRNNLPPKKTDYIKSFDNAFFRAVNIMKSSCKGAYSEKKTSDGFIEYIVRIPLEE